MKISPQFKRIFIQFQDRVKEYFLMYIESIYSIKEKMNRFNSIIIVKMYVKGAHKEGQRGRIDWEKIFVVHMSKQRFNVFRT